MLQKIAMIIGARPNFMKAAPVIAALKSCARPFDVLLIHTGQHYDAAMSKIFFDDLQLPQPDIYLGIGSGTHAEQTGRIMIDLEKIFQSQKPDLVMVVGDVNSTVAAALAAAKLCIPVAHIEAGLRSRDKTMPEEINRMVTDSISDHLFTTCLEANENLLQEGHAADHIYFVGNVMIDTLLRLRNTFESSDILSRLGLHADGETAEYALVTLHRPSNVDDRRNLRSIMGALQEISRKLPVVFPIHPRTKKMLVQYELMQSLTFLDAAAPATPKRPAPTNAIFAINPLGYIDFMKLVCSAKLVLTDSGGIQEETTVLKIPCLTLRDNTERAITVREGTNILVGNRQEMITEKAFTQLATNYQELQAPQFWDGDAAERIVQALLALG